MSAAQVSVMLSAGQQMLVHPSNPPAPAVQQGSINLLCRLTPDLARASNQQFPYRWRVNRVRVGVHSNIPIAMR